jgi:hypothetical protein
MPEPTRPDPAKTHGRENIIFIPTIASATLAPTVAEITGASALDVTRMAFKGAAPELGGSTERVTPDERFGDTESYEMIGMTKYEGGEAVFAWQPQALTGTDGKKAWEKFLNTNGTVSGYFAKREDIGRATTPVAGNRLSWVVPGEVGPPLPLKQGDGAAAQAAFRATWAVTGAPKFDVVVLA